MWTWKTRRRTSREVQGTRPLITQQATTQSVTDGGTVVIGGVIQTQNNLNVQQVPLLGNVPYLGNLFKRRSVTPPRGADFLSSTRTSCRHRRAGQRNTGGAGVLARASYPKSPRLFQLPTTLEAYLLAFWLLPERWWGMAKPVRGGSSPRANPNSTHKPTQFVPAVS